MSARAFLLLAAGAAASRPLATPRPIGANVEYMQHLLRAGQIAARPLRAAAAADPFNTSSLHGVAYLPSTARNAATMWLDYDAALVARELSFAAAASANAVRVPLSWAAWAVDAGAALSALDAFVAAAAAARLGVVLAVFDGLGDDVPAAAALALASDAAARKTADYIQSPGTAALRNASLAPSLDAFVAALVARYGRDARVIGWDAYLQPLLCGGDAGCPTPAFLARVTAALRAGVTGFVTFSVLPGGAACDAAQVPTGAGLRDVIAFENFNGNVGAVRGDGMGVQDCGRSLGGAPALLTGALGRAERPPSGVCETLFEAYGAPFIDVPAHDRFGVILPWLMIGVDVFTRDRPLPNQGLVWPSGTWYDDTERACFTAAVPPLPPPPPGPPPPGVNFTTSDGLVVGLRNSTRAVQVLGIAGDDRWFRNFSFVPPLWGFIPAKPHRDFGGCHHVGDVTLRVQPAASTNGSDWAFYSTSAAADDAPAEPLPFSDPNTFDVANLTAATAARPEDARFPLGVHIVRSVERAPGGYLGFAIRVNISVPAWGAAVRLGGFGFSLVSDTFFGGTNNTAIAASGSFLDAHVGLAAGHATFTRADGSRALLVTPCSASAALEAWRPLLEEPVPPNEGEWEWTVHSAAWASEWAQNKQAPALDFPDDAAHARAWPAPRSPWPSWHLHETVSRLNPRPWNAPSAHVIAPGETASYALCFSLPPAAAGAPGASGAPGGPRALDAGLAAAGRAVLVAVPGVVLGGDMAGAALFVAPPAGAALAAATSDDPALLTVGALGAPVNGFVRVPLAPAPAAHGRARLSLNFTDGTVGSAHYFILPPLAAHAATYGAFAASTAWLPRDAADAFGRSASFMPWDREDGVHVLQDGRPFVVGLSDDAGAGANLGMAAKLAAAPHAAQLALLDEYVNATLLGVKPDTATPPLFSLQDPVSWRILMTVWYYEKSPENATGYYQELDKCTMGPSWCAFNTPWCDHASGWCAAPPPRDPAVASGWPPGWTPASYRQYNFPHQIATYLALYLAARNAPRLALRNSAEFYLNAAVQSINTVNCVDAATGRAGCLVTVGLMDGTVFREVLRALKSEGAAWAADAARVEALQRARVFGDGAGGWNSMDNPAGSEFAWDTTGQEEVAVWGAYFNASDDDGWMHGELAGRTVDAILGYTGVSATWAFSGSSYGMGDFSNNAKWMVTGGWEREGGHYRSGLNSIPVIERYRSHPDDVHLLRAGIAGMTACLPNIDAAGAPSMAFHTHPFIMDHDPNSGDHGLAYFGHALNSGAYLHNDTALGLLCYLCDAAPTANGTITVTPRDSFRVRAYFEPLGLWLVAEAGRFALLTLSGAGGAAGAVAVTFESQADAAAAAGAPRAPYAALRLRVEAPAPAARRFAFTPPAGAAFVRGAWEFPPSADEGAQTVVAVGWARA